MSKRLSPLQRWRASYNYVSVIIREMKKNGGGGHKWGSFKSKRHQSRIDFMRDQARTLLVERPFAQQKAQELYEQSRSEPRRNSRSPAERIEIQVQPAAPALFSVEHRPEARTLLLRNLGSDESVSTDPSGAISYLAKSWPHFDVNTRVIHRDSKRFWNELTHDGHNFTGFRSSNAATPEEFLERYPSEVVTD